LDLMTSVKNTMERNQVGANAMQFYMVCLCTLVHGV